MTYSRNVMLKGIIIIIIIIIIITVRASIFKVESGNQAHFFCFYKVLQVKKRYLFPY